jgi:hypothetical protein
MRAIVLPLSITALFLLACSGAATDTAEDGATDAEEQEDGDGEEEDEEDEEAEEASAEERLQGSWALMPGDDALRRYKIMRAACSGNKKVLGKLGDLTDSEKRTFEYYEEQPKETKEGLLELIQNMQDTRYTFNEGKVVWSIGDNEILEKDYTIESEDPLHVKLEYGSTSQHWFIDWTDDDAAKVDVQYEGSDVKMEHNLKRK